MYVFGMHVLPQTASVGAQLIDRAKIREVSSERATAEARRVMNGRMVRILIRAQRKVAAVKVLVR